MGSLTMMDIITDKLLSFNLKKDEGFQPGSILTRFANYNSNFNQEHPELLHLLESYMHPFENSLFEQLKTLKDQKPLTEKLSRNFFMHNNLGFSPYLNNFVQDCVRSINFSEMIVPPLHDLSISRILTNTPLNKSELQHNYLNKNMNPDAKMASNPVNESITVKISLKNSPREEKVEDSKKCSTANGYTLNVELANRKTRELQKRSKKRRRRLKKNRQSSNNFKTSKGQVIPEIPSTNASPVCDSKNDQPGIGIVVSVEHNFLVSPSIVSSFVISVDSFSDDDSDWDCNSETNIHTDTEEFEFGGLLVTNLTIPKAYSHPSLNCTLNKNDDLDETSDANASLVQVNKKWNESHTDLKRKSSSKVSFAADDQLTEVLTVENYERKGEWEIYAIERLRFKRRIEELERIISPCLTSEHRLKVYRKLTESSL